MQYKEPESVFNLGFIFQKGADLISYTAQGVQNGIKAIGDVLIPREPIVIPKLDFSYLQIFKKKVQAPQLELAFLIPRKATVHILMCNLTGVAGIVSVAVHVATIFTTIPNVKDGREAKHWAIVVQFEGDSCVYICELIREPDEEGSSLSSGDINWRCERISEDELVRGKTGVIIYYLGTVLLSPEELKEKCAQISINNYKYNALLRNCQHWSRELVVKLGASTLKMDVHAILMLLYLSPLNV